MAPALRSFLIGLAASALAIWVGFNLAQEDYFLAALSLCLCLWALLAWLRGPRVEAWLLAFLLAGYLIGSRGFAQITPLPELPLFVGELGLGFAGFMWFVRGALERRLPWSPTALHGLLLFWLLLGAGRIFWDARAFGLMALRDFALLYYLLFYFFARELCLHAPSRRLLSQTLTVTFFLLPLSALGTQFFSDIFLHRLVLNRVPLVLQKGDLLAMGLFAGFIWLLPERGIPLRVAGGRWLGALASLCSGLTMLSRASMLGLFIALGWLALARRWRHLAVTAAVGVAGLAGGMVYSTLQGRTITDTKVYAIYEAVLSVADFSGTRSYLSERSGNKGDNNRFRLVWWRTVVEETIATNPWLGLGFGADLARSFLLEYYAGEDLEFTARSPHNVFITTFGRMGLAGLIVLLAIYATIARDTWRSCRHGRARPADETEGALRLRAIVWLMMIGACFGVVLEGPMGAIPFWIILGLAQHTATEPGGAKEPARPTGSAVSSVLARATPLRGATMQSRVERVDL
jgi:hypothetical protein